MDIAYSKNNVPIRLTDERWVHIIENHDDLAGQYDTVLMTIEDPDYILQGYMNALMALTEISPNKFFVAVYKELHHEDGFVITAYISSKIELTKESIIWHKK